MGTKDQLGAMTKVANALDALEDDEDLARVVEWVNANYRRRAGALTASVGRAPETALADGETGFGSIGELMDAAQPTSQYDRILAVCYWFQETQKQPDFTGVVINDEMKNQGHAVANITDAFTKLMRRSPAPVRQTRKEGTTKQARKRYALTEAGKKAVIEMFRRRNSGEEGV